MSSNEAVWDRKVWSVPSGGPCSQCGVDVSRATPGELGLAILMLLPRWAAALMHPGAGRASGTLGPSTLERAVQVRDVFGSAALRLGRMLDADDPLLQDWSSCGATPRIGVLDPGRVAAELDDAGRAVIARLGALPPSQVVHRGSGSDGTPVTVLSLGRRVMHHAAHHLHDVTAWRPSAGWPSRTSSCPQNLSTGL